MHKKLIIIVLTLVFYNTVYGREIELAPATEMFILKSVIEDHGRHNLYIRTLNLGEKNTYGWIEYYSTNANGKIFSINPIDKLSFPTKNIENAFYYVLTNYSTLTIDTKTFNNSLESKHLKKRFNDNIYSNMDNYLPISNSSVIEAAQDLYNSCPTVPSRKNGKSCLTSNASNLSLQLKTLIRNAANKFKQEPSLLASIIQHESNFDLFAENLHEKKKCLKNEKECSPYKWGKGLSQLGATDAHFFGLDWNKKLRKTKACRDSNILNSKCLHSMLSKCKKYKNKTYKPINCPIASIEAVARKLQSLIPETVSAWIKESVNDDSKSIYTNLSPVLKKNRVTKIRNLIGLYNRGVKVFNSYVEHYDSYGKFPDNFGSTWATERRAKSPSTSMGYQMLTREYIGRCYVWELAGICGDIPEHSLVNQYEFQFN